MKKKSVNENLKELQEFLMFKKQKLDEINVIKKEISKTYSKRRYREKAILAVLDPLVDELVKKLNVLPNDRVTRHNGSFYEHYVGFYFYNWGGNSVEVQCPFEHLNENLLSKKLYQLAFKARSKYGSQIYEMIPSDDSEIYFDDI